MPALPGIGLLLLAITELSSISPVALAYTPIGAIFVLLVMDPLAKRFIPGLFAASLVASIVLLRVFSTTMFSVWPHMFGFMLFFLFVYVFLDLLNKRTIESLAALWILFLGLYLYSYTAEIYAISFLLFANVLMLVRPRNRLPTFSLLFSFVVTYLAFNQVLYNTFVPKFSVYSDQAAQAFGYYLTGITQTRGAPLAPWLYVPASSPLVLRLLNAACTHLHSCHCSSWRSMSFT